MASQAPHQHGPNCGHNHGPAASQQQQQQAPKEKPTDQTSGELEPCIHALAQVDIKAKIGNFHNADEELRTKAPEIYQQIEKFKKNVALASSLSDVTASKFKDDANKDYQNKNLDVAILNYTKAMTFCETDTLMATLLNNRSTALYAQRRFRDSCLDATYALALNTEYWKAYQRRGKCLEELGHAELGKKDEEAAEQEDASLACPREEVLKLIRADESSTTDGVVPKNPTVLDIHDKIHIESDVKGRFIVADERLDKGQTILMETPYAQVQRLEGTFTSCALCLKRTSLLFPSPHYRRNKVRCRGLFCSESCADRHWELFGEEEHKNPYFLVCPTDGLLAHRMMKRKVDKISVAPKVTTNEAGETITTPVELKLNRGPKSTGEESTAVKPNNDFGSKFVETLTVFSKEIQPIGEVGGRETILTSIALAFDAVTKEEAEQYRHYLRRIPPNAMNIGCVDRVIPEATPEQHSFISVNVGKAVYTIASMFNHSCDPNCYVSFKGSPHSCCAQLCIRLLRPCMEGEELTISYANIHIAKNHSTRARIRQTRNLYGFNCTCIACFNKVDEPVKKDDEQFYFKASDYYQKGRRLTREGNYEEAINVLFQSYECVMRYICPPPRPPQMMLPKTHDALAQAYLLQGNKGKCVEHLKASIELLMKLNGELDPDLIREYTKMAFLLASSPTEIEEDGTEKVSVEAKEYADKAKEMLTLFYCPSAHLDAELAYLDTVVGGKQ